jgi:hypothetical protein
MYLPVRASIHTPAAQRFCQQRDTHITLDSAGGIGSNTDTSCDIQCDMSSKKHKKKNLRRSRSGSSERRIL